MTDRSGNDGRLSPLHLWIADQVRNDVTSWPVGAQRGVARPLPLWIADQARNDVTRVACPAGFMAARPLPLWIADQVRNDVTSWPVGAQRGVSPSPSFPPTRE